MNLVIFGAPGSGKGTQSEKIVERYALHHISTGELLRGHIARGTELGQIADSIISKGQLLPDELMLNILAAELDAHPQVKGVIFDGFPRTIPQAEALEKMLAERGQKVDAVVGLEVPEAELQERMLKRAQISGRADDNPATIARRLEVYRAQTEPLKAYYQARNAYNPIEGSGSIDDIFARIAAVTDPLHEATNA